MSMQSRLGGVKNVAFWKHFAYSLFRGKLNQEKQCQPSEPFGLFYYRLENCDRHRRCVERQMSAYDR